MSGQPDIIVEAFSPRFLAAYRKVAVLEGGFVDDPDDRGGATNLGVSLRFLVGEGKIDTDGDGVGEFDLDMDGDIDVADVRRLTPVDAKMLFQRCFWNRLNCDDLPAPIGEAMFDQAVNGGLVAARRLLQQAINRVCAQFRGIGGCPAVLETDGVIGRQTRDALDWVLRLPCGGKWALIAAYRVVAAERYRTIVARNPTQKRFLNGWLRRATALGVA